MHTLAPRAATSGGTVIGMRTSDVEAFLGVPYADPPLGPLRWRLPQPVTPWGEPRECSAFGADSAQAPSTEAIRTTPSEDSLFVNVWRPAGTRPDARLPVLVWIHGGGFLGGGSSIPWYDGSALAARGMVVVSLNYRLGRIGFFAHPALLAGRGAEPVANYGFMDQVAALTWVRDEIAAFGGDPGSVTLTGQSAGGASVLALLTSREARGLFHRVMVLSGGGRGGLVLRPLSNGTRAHPSADQIDADFAASLGIAGDGGDALAALRAVPAATLQGTFNLEDLAQEALLGRGVYGGTPMLGGYLVAGHPGDLLASGEAAGVPLLIGTTAIDMPFFLAPSRLQPLSWFGREAAAARHAYGAPRLMNRKQLVRLHARIGADRTMHEPARYVATRMRDLGNRSWLFRFSYTEVVSRNRAPGQTHAGELPFMFDRLHARFGPDVAEEDQAMADVFSGYVTNYVLTGDPNGGGLPTWPTFDPASYDLMHFAPDGEARVERDPLADRVALVERATVRSGGGGLAASP